MTSIREFLNTPAGRLTAIGLIVVAVALLGWQMYASFFAGQVGQDTGGNVTYICSETGQTFEAPLGPQPTESPHSGSATGYMAEFCWWTKDGQIKEEPTPVLMNRHVDKPEPTFCPDCGRLVFERAPKPSEGFTAPPTKQEYDRDPDRYESMRP